jgi:hypothetical protein
MPMDVPGQIEYKTLEALIETWSAMLRAAPGLSGVRVPMYALSGQQKDWVRDAIKPLPDIVVRAGEEAPKEVPAPLGEYRVSGLRLDGDEVEVMFEKVGDGKFIRTSVQNSPRIGQKFYLIPKG